MTSTTSNSEVCTGEGIVRLCPLCNSALKFFFINFTEKVCMCEKLPCPFPFGYEDIHIIQVKTEIEPEIINVALPESNNKLSLPSASSSTSRSSNKKLNKTRNTDKIKVPNMYISPSNLKEKSDSDERINNKEIKKNVMDLKNLTMELSEIEQDTEDYDVIKNKRWINKLMKLQGMSGMKLVKKQEMALLQKKTPTIHIKELKIDIDTNPNQNPSINIQIKN